MVCSVSSLGCANWTGKTKGLVHHVVLLRAKPSTAAETIDELAKQLHGMKCRIPEVINIAFGSQDDAIYEEYKKRHDGVTHVLVVTVRDGEALKRYMESDEHKRVVTEHISPIIEESKTVALDFKDSRGAHCPPVLKWGGIFAGMAVAYGLGFATNIFFKGCSTGSAKK